MNKVAFPDEKVGCAENPVVEALSTPKVARQQVILKNIVAALGVCRLEQCDFHECMVHKPIFIFLSPNLLDAFSRIFRFRYELATINRP